VLGAKLELTADKGASCSEAGQPSRLAFASESVRWRPDDFEQRQWLYICPWRGSWASARRISLGLARFSLGTVKNVSWSKYGEFLAFAVVLILIPGLDFAVVTKNTLAGGRRRGRWTALGVSSSNLAQGTAVAFGLSALIVKVQPLFESIKWAGVAYLAYLGVQALRSARRGEYAPLDGNGLASTAQNAAGWRQGFISNITNPKVLVFYLAVLPQFLAPGAGLGWLLLLAWSHAVLSLGYLLVLVTGLHGARRLLMRQRVRRALDATTGAVLLGFGARLATEHV
jgi:threonine/homoserine/homoserine lactone efflux protein